MSGTLQLAAPISSWCRRRQVPQRRLTVTFTCCALQKKSDRFLTSLEAIAAVGDVAAGNRLIRKFVDSSPKGTVLNALCHLLSPDRITHSNLSFLALPLYSGISKARWFTWNPKLVANLIALLDEQGQHRESQTLISDAVSKLEHKERDLAQFYCDLIKFQCKHKSKQGFQDSCTRLTQLLHDSEDNHVKRQAFESLVGGLCKMDQPSKAESLIEEMRVKGLKPSSSHYKYIVHAYGRSGLFEDMLRNMHKIEAEGYAVDVVCSTMVLSSYGAHKQLSQIITWLRTRKSLGLPFTIHTYNAVSYSCPTIMSLLQDLSSIPISMEELKKVLDADEGLVVNELVESSSSVLERAMEWGASEVKLDLHGMQLASAYLIMLQWMEEMQCRLKDRNQAIPAEVTVVSGWGKHSKERGKSTVKKMVRELMIRTSSPMRIDRLNLGCFTAKGKAVKNWLCCDN